MGIGAKITIAGLLIRGMQALISSTGLTSPAMVILFVASMVLCVLGVIVSFCEGRLISAILQIAGTVALIVSAALAADIWTVVCGGFLLYGIIQAFINGNPVYVIWIFW